MTLVLLAGLLVITLNAKDHTWETGTVVDAERTSRYAGQTGGVTEACPNCVSTPINVTIQTVVIAGDDYSAPLGRFHQEYTAQRNLTCFYFVCPKEAALIVNTPVKFAVENRKRNSTAVHGKLFLIDDNGKPFEFDIVKQIQQEAK